MELQQLKYFVEVASQLHFGRAAERLHASQQTVSHQIGQLENEVGLKLFKRTTRKVELTLAGEALLQEVQFAFEHLQRGIDEAKRAETGRRGRLKIGYSGIMLYTVLPSAIRLYRELYPDVEIVMQELDSDQVEQKLLEGEIDIGFSVDLNDKHSEQSMRWLPFSTEPLVVALPKKHHLSDKQHITLADLKNESFVILNRNDSPALFDSFILLCRQAGFTPQIVQQAASDQAVVGLVATGIGVAFVLGCMSKMFENDITFIPLTEPRFELTLGICWLRSHPSAQVDHFVEVMRSFKEV
ncbi:MULTISPECIES: LysR family transcriptional regulator [Paenibacillus]|uniref:LysR family transcriptional regulator n=1 Tax=Paenibacillus pabuli TaxID=1472 RepID=A0A855Y6J1_9BACL|nr:MULTISPECIES: LysR family transcriptional regulator [Paenibacillus]PWW38668.1 LysR family transcriptional regulator [Paenibacillus pabuli]PXW05853.1 LysR family transcriptional regulator [Paenibacillus taichungensis]RAI85896.1 LysR family transcriptional regulator [Paenibacillus pabuli]